MKNYNLRDYFKEKIHTIEIEEDDELLDYSHKFLKMAVMETTGVSECEIGNFEIPARNLRIDGYYEDEDEKIFHILGMIDADDCGESSSLFFEKFKSIQNKIYSFIFLCLSKDVANLLTTSPVYEAAMSFIDAKNNGYTFEVDYYCNNDFPDDFNEQASIKLNKLSLTAAFYGASEIYESITSNESSNLMIDLVNDYGTSLYALRISSNKDCDIYLTSVPGRLLARIYNNHKSRLLEGNVRSYLKRTQKTNSGIVRTLQNVPSEFVAYNNGLSTVASSTGTIIKAVNGNFVEITTLNQLQIVNGGQTTVTIYECSKDPIDLSDVVVPMKLTVLKRRENEAEMVSNISRFANTQTAIAKSDLSSNEPFYKMMEKLSRSIPSYTNGIVSTNNEYYWFFERSNGQYNTERRVIYNYSKSFARRYPEKLKYSKKILAKAIMSYQKKPHIVCLGNEKNFVTFNDYVVENCIIPDETYYKRFIGALILWRSVDKIILKAKLPIKAAVLPYTIAKLSLIFKSSIDLENIWEKQKIDENLSSIILDLSTTISRKFQDEIVEHPNTLMWARKEECWEEVKNMTYNIVYSLEKMVPIDFMPKNPAIVFIDKRDNLVSYNLWSRLLLWNSSAKALTTQQEKIIKEFMTSISLGAGTGLLDSKIKAVKDLFIRAVRNGFMYKEAI